MKGKKLVALLLFLTLTFGSVEGPLLAASPDTASQGSTEASLEKSSKDSSAEEGNADGQSGSGQSADDQSGSGKSQEGTAPSGDSSSSGETVPSGSAPADETGGKDGKPDASADGSTTPDGQGSSGNSGNSGDTGSAGNEGSTGNAESAGNAGSTANDENIGNAGSTGKDGGSQKGMPADEKAQEKPEAESAKREALEAGETKSLTARFRWEGDGIGTPEEINNRPQALNVTLMYTTDGGNTWLPYWGTSDYIVSDQDPNNVNTLIYTWNDLPAVDPEENPVEYGVTQEKLNYYTTKYDAPQDIDETHREILVRNSYNDNWNYRIDLRWDVSDPQNKYRIEDVTIDPESKRLSYALTISAQKRYEVGDLEVRMPYSLMSDRNGRPITPSIGLGDYRNPSPDYSFTYRIDDHDTPDDESDDEVVFFNYEKIDGNDNITIRASYEFFPSRVKDFSEGELTATGTGYYTDSAGIRQDAETQISNTISYKIDTGVSIGNVRKNFTRNIYYWDDAWGEEPEDFDMEKYNYVLYRSSVYVERSNQYYYYIVTDSPDSDGEIYRVNPGRQDEYEVKKTADGYEWQTPSDYRSGVNNTDFGFEIIARYPRTPYPDPDNPGQFTYETDYKNSITFQKVAADVHEGDKEPGDQNDLAEKSTSVTSHWVDYEYHYDGEIYAASKYVSKDNTMVLDVLKYGKEATASVQLGMTVNGYDYSNGYRVDLSDDAVYARATINGSTTKYVPLSDEDYYFSASSISTTEILISNTAIDRMTGQEIPGEIPEGDITVLGRNGAGEAWTPIGTATFNKTEGNTNYYRFATPADAQYAQIKVSLPEGFKEKTDVTIRGLTLVLRPDSPVIKDWMEQGNLTQIHFENFAAFDSFVADSTGTYQWANSWSSSSDSLANDVGLDDIDKGEFGAYRFRKNAGWDMPAGGFSTRFVKSEVSKTDDKTHQEYKVRYRLSALETCSTSALPKEIYQSWACNSAAFYDLLPEGFVFDSAQKVDVYGAHYYITDVRGVNMEGISSPVIAPALLDDIEIIDDYKGTGRQMVIFKVKSSMEPGQNYGTNYSVYGVVWSGFGVEFSMKAKYDNIPTGQLYNLAACKRTDGQLFSAGFSQDRFQPAPNTPIPIGNDGHQVFYDYDGDGDVSTKDSRYDYKSLVPQFDRSVENAVSKRVRASSGQFVSSDTSDVGSDYTYRIKLRTAEGGTTKNVVLYDVLENAANVDGQSGEIPWQGKLKGVDTSNADKKGIAVKVLYSTVKGLSYNEEEKLLIESAPEGTWSETPPADLSQVTAIAFDLRYKPNGQDAVFRENEEVYVDIIMKAPDELQTPAECAYNRPASRSTYVPNNSSSESTTFSTGTRTVVRLHQLQELLLYKYTDTQVPGSNPDPLAGASFTLYRCTRADVAGHTHSPETTGDTCWEAVRSVSSKEDGKVYFDKLDTGIYRLQEVSVPSGYTRFSSSYYWLFEVDATKGTVEKPQPQGNVPALGGNAQNGYTLTNPSEKMYLNIYKSWEGSDITKDYLPATIIFDVYRQKEEDAERELYRSVTLNVSPEQSGTRISVPKYYDGIHKWIWTVEERPIAGYTQTGYRVVHYSNDQDLIYLTNTQDTVEISAKKAWKNLDGSTTPPEGAKATFALVIDGVQSSYQLTLDGTADGTKPTGKGGYESEPWKCTFVNFPEYKYVNNQPVKIVYTVKEVGVSGAAGYAATDASEVEPDGTITNEQEQTEVSASKVWENADGSSAAPSGASVVYTLYADGKKTIYTVTLDGTVDSDVPAVLGGYESEAWKASFVHLPKKDPTTGADYAYTVKETTGYPGYTGADSPAVSDGGSITNKQEETEISSFKKWVNIDGTTDAPADASVVFTLCADGEDTSYAVTLDGEVDEEPSVTGGYESEAWKASFIHLPKKNTASGKDITYTVKETVGYKEYKADKKEASDQGSITNVLETEPQTKEPPTSSNTKTSGVKTGDETPLVGWSLLMLIAAVIVVGIIRKKRLGRS